MLIDSHCHLDRLDLVPYGGDFDCLVKDTLDQGIDHLLCVSITLEKYVGMRALVDPYPEISVSVGVHPTETSCEEPDSDRLVALAADSKVVAIGETGLDYFRGDEGFRELQQSRLRVHIDAARRVQKPLIIHTREAKEDTLRILKEEGAGEVGGVFHCFTEDWETGKKALDLGFYLSLSGILTFPSALQIQEVARNAPLDRLLVETDSPYLAPVPLRGKPNYPLNVRLVAKYLAELRGIPFEEVARATSRNYGSLFGLKALA